MRVPSVRGLVLAGLLFLAAPARAQDASPAPIPPEAAPMPATPPLPPAADAPAPPPSPPVTPAPTPPPPDAVQVQSLGQLDLFSAGRDTGLGPDVWKGASADLLRAILPELAQRPLSPAAAALARRLLAQAASAPPGAGSDLGLAAARARALLALGDAEDAALIFARTPGVSDSPELSRAAAEAALVGEQDDQACRIADRLTTGRETPDWLRLRAFCQARAGQADAAQLTFNLAAPPPAKGKAARVSASARLLGVFIAGAGDPGPASLRSGLDYALSRALKLDLTPAMASAEPAIARRLALTTAQPEVDAPPPGPIADALAAAKAPTPDGAALEALCGQASKAPDARARARLQAAAVILASLGGEATGAARAQMAAFALPRFESSSARLLTLQLDAASGRKGETALLAVAVSGSGGSPADRAAAIRALLRVGLKDDAHAFAVEGLSQLAAP